MSVTHANKTESAKEPQGAKTMGEAAPQFADSRAATTAQLAMQQLMHNSPRSTAQRVIANAMSAPVPQQKTIQRAEDEELLQGKFETAQRAEDEELLQGKFELAQRAEKPNNTGLPDNLKSGIENLSGMSMDHVKVHYNSDKPAQLQAHAYAQGSEIHVAPGQEKHLPHEAWHVVQQAQGRVKPTMQMKGDVPVNNDVGLENEADVMGAKATKNITQLIDDRAHSNNSILSTSLNTNCEFNSESVQRKLNAQGKYKVCGPMAATSAESWEGFLNDEDIVDRFFPNDEAKLKTIYEEVKLASEAHKASKGATTGNVLNKLHTKLVASSKAQSVSPGGTHWDSLLQMASLEIEPQSSGKFIQKNAKDAAEKVWPVSDLGAVPESFWKAVLKDAKPKPILATPKVIPDLATAVLTHANERFNAWRTGAEANRGAWAGSNSHGEQPGDYEAVANTTLQQLTLILPHGGWRLAFSLSAEEGNSLHRYGGAAKGQDFIYHL